MSYYYSHSHANDLQAERHRRLSNDGPGSLWSRLEVAVGRIAASARTGRSTLRQTAAATSPEPCLDCP